MNRDQYISLTIDSLKAHLAARPLCRDEDIVKFVFQALLGVGHLLKDRNSVIEYIKNELSLQSGPFEGPLAEPVGPGWARLDLREAEKRGIGADVIVSMMLASKPPIGFTREDVLNVCLSLKNKLNIELPEEALGRVTDPDWLPSHSDAYRKAYRPCYRLISSSFADLLSAIAAIAGKAASSRRVLVTLDGSCASGKTTLAAMLGSLFDAKILHTDDFVVPHARKTPERLSIPGGNCDHERLVSEALAPWKSGLDAVYRRYDWNADGLREPKTLSGDGVVILEGSYCNLPDIRELADVRLFMATPPEIRMERLARRESKESLQRFFDRWIPLEDAYFEAYKLPDEGCILIK